MQKHIFNHTFAFGISRKALVAMAILATCPAAALADPAPATMAPAANPAGHWSTPGTQAPAVPATMAPVSIPGDQVSPPEVIVVQAPVNVASFAFAVPTTANTFG